MDCEHVCSLLYADDVEGAISELLLFSLRTDRCDQGKSGKRNFYSLLGWQRE